MKVGIKALAVAAVAAGAACSTSSSSSVDDSEFSDRLASYIESAESTGADAEQVAVLERAQETGEISFEAYSESVDRALRCLREAGYDPHDGGVYEEFGVQWRRIGTPADAEDDPAEMVELMPGVTEHRCFAEHSSWVHMAYGEQPSTIEAHEAHFEQYRSAILECLAEEGVDVDPDLGRAELELASVQAVQDGMTEVDCLYESGYTSGESG